VDRQCARPTCNESAVAAFNFDGLRRIVWLNAITEARTTAGHLCDRHADRLRPPVHWELRDLRSGEVTVTVGEIPAERPVRIGNKAAQQRRGRALLPDDEDAAPAADESTPLLARAFRAAG
jgi:Protein of unknown function (DUF3499)